MKNDPRMQSCEALLRRMGVELALLHGSAATGKQGVGSDLDVAVCRRGAPLSFEAWDEIRSALENALGAGTDVGVVDTGSDPLYAHEAFLHGRILWQASAEAFGWWASLVARRYDDTRWLREMEAEMVRNRFGGSKGNE